MNHQLTFYRYQLTLELQVFWPATEVVGFILVIIVIQFIRFILACLYYT